MFKINYKKNKILVYYFDTNSSIKNIKNINLDYLYDINRYLNKNKIEIKYSEYDNIIKNIEKNDLVVLDPPYSEQKYKYNIYVFDQKKFNKEVIKLNNKGCYIILFNEFNKKLIEFYIKKWI